MELRHLRYFLTVGRFLNFTKAAEVLHISQPPLSRQIQELEEEIGTPLFLREGKKIQLTEAGAYFLQESEKILDGISAVCGTARMIGRRSKSLNVGCVSFFLSSSLAMFLETARKEAPGMKLEILVMSTEAQERALLSGTIEVGFVRSWISRERLVFLPVASESLAVVMPSSGREPETPEDCMHALEKRPFIALSRSAAEGLAGKINDACASYGVVPEVALECNDAFSIMSLVAAGTGWSILPSLELQSAQVEGIHAVRLPHKLVIGLAYRADVASEETRKFVELVRNYYAPKDIVCDE